MTGSHTPQSGMSLQTTATRMAYLLVKNDPLDISALIFYKAQLSWCSPTLQHLSYDGCLDVRGEIIRNVKLCTVISTLR